MIFGNLSQVFEGEQNIYEAVNSNFSPIQQPQYGNTKGPGKLAKILYTLSHYGMNWSDDVTKNMNAIPADKLLQPKDDVVMQSNLFGGMMDNWKKKPEEDKPFKEKTLEQKREVLRKMATNPELEDILDILANEAIVYDEDEVYIGEPYIEPAILQQLNEQHIEEIQNAVDAAFYKMYMLLNWKNKAWDEFKRWLIDGVVSYEIVYDDIENPHSIIGIVAVDPATLTRVIENGVEYWVQFKDVIGQERKLLSSQIIYIKYEDSGVLERQSYLERLIRPFNIYRIIEQAQVIWTVTQSSFKTIFTIPVAGMNKAKGMQTLNSAMARYKEDIDFNTETGELQVNGRVNLPFNKEYWMPENENGKPEIETLADQGPSLQDSDQLKYFLSKLYKMSKIPENRFDKEAQATWFGSDPTQTLRDEINFGRFVNRLRNVFAQIIIKPIQIQISLSIPELKNDKRVLDAIILRYNSYNQFEEMMNIEIDTKRMEFVSTLREAFMSTDAEGNEEHYFSDKFLIMRYLKMSDSDLEWNEKCKLEEKQARGDEESDEEGEDDMGGDEEMSGDMGSEDIGGEDSGMESDETGGGDSEMMGDVQPDNTADTGGEM
jgi:hypothetical protein